MAGRQSLPRPDYHFRRHRREFDYLGIYSEPEYLALFERHIQRRDLLHLTHLRLRDGHRIWYRIAPDTGVVAQYDETAENYQSFYLPVDVDGFLEAGRGWWVEVQQTAAGWRITPWG